MVLMYQQSSEKIFIIPLFLLFLVESVLFIPTDSLWTKGLHVYHVSGFGSGQLSHT